MDSMLEKITLYDIMSYFIPGFLCLSLIVFSTLPELSKLNLDTYNDLQGYAAFTFLIFSYVVGIAISSIARTVCKRVSDKWSKCCGKSKEGEKKNAEMMPVLMRALKNSGIPLSESKEEGNEWGCLAKKYGSWIYADIQADSRYKRIHNYASCESMYKNLSAAFLTTAVLTWVLHWGCGWQLVDHSGMLLGIEMILAVIFGFRWRRFEKKKNEYAVNWFMEKYAGEEAGDIKKKLNNRAKIKIVHYMEEERMRDESDIQLIRIFRRKADDVIAFYIQEFFKFAGCIVYDQICEDISVLNGQIDEQDYGHYDMNIILNLNKLKKLNLYGEVQEYQNQSNYILWEGASPDAWQNIENEKSVLLSFLCNKIWRDPQIARDFDVLNMAYTKSKLFWYIYTKANFKYIQEYFPEEGEQQKVDEGREKVYQKIFSSFADCYNELVKKKKEDSHRSLYFDYAVLLMEYKLNGLKLLVGEQRFFRTEGMMEQAKKIQGEKPDFIRIYYLLASICAKDNRYYSMICPFLRQAILEIKEKNGDSRVLSFLYYQMGRYYEKREKDLVKAKEQYDLSFQLDPSYYRVLYKEAHLLKLKEQKEEAFSFANRLNQMILNGYEPKKLMPKQQIYAYKCLMTEGELMFAMQKYDLAETKYKKAIDVAEADSVFFDLFSEEDRECFRNIMKLGMPVGMAKSQLRRCQSVYL